MRDVVKTNVKRKKNSKRARRRKKNIPLYFFLIFIFVIGIGILLSVTVLFNINKIVIKGEVDYSDENVIKASGLSIGDNMVRLDAKKSEENILTNMIYVEEVDIDKKYPDTLEINLVKCVPSANVECEDGYILISKKGKILEKKSEPINDIITIKGLEPASFNQGEYIKSSNELKTNVYLEIIEALANSTNKALLIDMSDIYNVKVNYDNRIDFEVGNPTEISYKIKLADTVISDIDKNKKGTLVMVGTNQISFREDNESSGSVKPSVKVPISEEDLPEGYTQPSTEPTTEYTEYSENVVEDYDNNYIDVNDDNYENGYEYNYDYDYYDTNAEE